MKTVIQKSIVQIIQPRIVQYTCDLCGKKLGKGNPKQTVYHGAGDKAGEQSHYCKKTCEWGGIFNELMEEE